MNLSTQLAISNTIKSCSSTVYVEELSALHEDITKKVWQWTKDRIDVKAVAGPIVDIGSGKGVALKMFDEDGLEAIGVTASKEEMAYCNSLGHTTMLWDFHDLSQLTNFASGIWLRHAAEHSFMPYMLLRSCHEALRPGGWLYMEVPAPETASRHEANPNHFSVMGKLMWAELLQRAGFQILDSINIEFSNQLGEDKYFAFLVKK